VRHQNLSKAAGKKFTITNQTRVIPAKKGRKEGGGALTNWLGRVASQYAKVKSCVSVFLRLSHLFLVFWVPSAD